MTARGLCSYNIIYLDLKNNFFFKVSYVGLNLRTLSHMLYQLSQPATPLGKFLKLATFCSPKVLGFLFFPCWSLQSKHKGSKW